MQEPIRDRCYESNGQIECWRKLRLKYLFTKSSWGTVPFCLLLLRISSSGNTYRKFLLQRSLTRGLQPADALHTHRASIKRRRDWTHCYIKRRVRFPINGALSGIFYLRLGGYNLGLALPVTRQHTYITHAKTFEIFTRRRRRKEGFGVDAHYFYRKRTYPGDP